MEYKKDVSAKQQTVVACMAKKSNGSKLMRVYFGTTSETRVNDDDTSQVMYTSNYIELWSDKNTPLDLAKEYAVNKAEEYGDKDVNEFFVNGNTCWLDKATRVGINNAILMLKRKNAESCTLILDEIHSMTIESAQDIMDKIETYSYLCHVQTEKHVDSIKSCESFEDVIAYDYTSDYPKKISLTI